MRSRRRIASPTAWLAQQGRASEKTSVYAAWSANLGLDEANEFRLIGRMAFGSASAEVRYIPDSNNSVPGISFPEIVGRSIGVPIAQKVSVIVRRQASTEHLLVPIPQNGGCSAYFPELQTQ